MIEKLKGLIEKYYEQLAYLFFGGLATLLNIVLALVFRWMGMPTTWNTLLDNVVCILFAYCTNRIWVFRSHSKGMDALREFASFIGCRLGTLVMDVAIMYVCVDLLGWNSMIIKVLSNVLVIIVNYVASKLVIFRKR